MSKTISPVLGEATVQELREAVRGAVLTPADEGYADASKVWNGAHDGRRPALVVRCLGAADVIAAVGFALANSLPVAVRGGGHSIAGFSTCDDGIVIDLSLMNGVRVDPSARVASVGGGAVWADVDHETQAHGLATTGGLISTTGVGGFTLGGGIGWIMRRAGLACDNLVGADVVTADGRLVRATETENADLLWGLRGGGGNFGIVTQLDLRLHPVGPMVYAGPIVYPADASRDLMRAFREWAPGAPDTITGVINLTTAPPLPVIPADWHGKKVAMFIGMSTGPVDAGESLVAPFRSVAEPIADLLGPMPYRVMQTLIDPLWAKGLNAYFKATNLRELDDDLIERLAALHLETPGPQCEVHVHQMGGAVGRVAEDATAFSERSMPYVLNSVTGWHGGDAGPAHIQWARDVIAAASDASTGRSYVNFLGDSDAARESYSASTYERLVDLKRRYDPSNVFALNQNIVP
ncbi:MAG TPA: FAD-binding oxidoreductase [Gaiellaceae bacterium]|jgi:FAD/FMN-containing dehydrogenase|nr:FAD-binding oxidoreductase [Gaiellaceae bacterium]